MKIEGTRLSTLFIQFHRGQKNLGHSWSNLDQTTTYIYIWIRKHFLWWFDKRRLKIERARLSTFLYSFSQGSKILKIRPKNSRILAALGWISTKLLWMNTFRLEETFCSNLIKKYWKLKELDFLHFLFSFTGVKKSLSFLVRIWSNHFWQIHLD